MVEKIEDEATVNKMIEILRQVTSGKVNNLNFYEKIIFFLF